MFFRGFELSVYNAFVMIKTHHPKKSFLEFRMNLVRQILEISGGLSANRSTPIDTTLRLQERHFPSYNDQKRSRRCHVCAKHQIERRTVFGCRECEAVS